MNNRKSQKNDEKLPTRKTKKAREVAAEIGIHVETLYDWIRDGILINSEYIMVPRPVRPRYIFFENTAQMWIDRNSRQLNSPDRPKRTYNRRAVKGKHAKQKG
jgi:hypothetical protein